MTSNFFKHIWARIKVLQRSSRNSKCIGMGRMATGSGRREGAPAAAAKFFKIIMDPKADDLRIPDEFTKRYGHNLPNPVYLKIPSGRSTMKVELNQYNGKTWLQKGWQEFKERYSIGFGHFLVFEYNGKSEFNVIIFDMTAVEINYPFVADYKRVTDEEPESDEPVVLFEDFSTGNGGKGKAENQENTTQKSIGRQSRHCDDVIEIPDDYPLKKSHREMHNLPSCYEKDSKSKLSSPYYRVKHDESTYEGCSDGSGNQCSKRVGMQKSVVKKKSIAYQKAIDFVSGLNPKNPFFICLMQHSYVSYGFSMYVPLSFAERSLPCEGANSIIIVTNGKKWSVRCLLRNSRAELSSGWKGFVQDNGIKLGDACLFEVAKSNKLVWNVVIFRS